MTDACEHRDVTWYAADAERRALNEAAWTCLDCEADLGFRPDLDRSHTEIKARCILADCHESRLIYVSNGTMGDGIAFNVARRCIEVNRYDQWSILAFILADPNLDDHGAFWQNRAERWLLGGDEPIRSEQEALAF